jgi:ribosome-binding factor A
MSRRTEQLGSTIRKALAEIILRELNDPRLVGMPSITRVKLSADLSVADVYVTIMGTPGQKSAALNALRHSAGLMRSKLGGVLSMRVVPYLKFHIDENLKKELAVLELLQKVAEERAAREGAEGQSPPSSEAGEGDPGEGRTDPEDRPVRP